jgi:hypothetical protein
MLNNAAASVYTKFAAAMLFIESSSTAQKERARRLLKQKRHEEVAIQPREIVSLISTAHSEYQRSAIPHSDGRYSQLSAEISMRRK